VAVWGTLQGEQVNLGVNVACADAASAGQLAQGAEKGWNGQKAEIIGGTVLLNQVGMGKTAKLLAEVAGNIKFAADGTMAKVTTNTNKTTIADAVDELQKKNGAGGGGFVPGGPAGPGGGFNPGGGMPGGGPPGGGRPGGGAGPGGGRPGPGGGAPGGGRPGGGGMKPGGGPNKP
jgi:hypothetical protein